MTYLLQAAYTTVTPNLAAGSDPSRGPAGNPVVLRRGQTLQNLIYRSVQSQGALIPEPATATLADCQVVITVDTVDYPDPNAPIVGVDDDFFEPDVIQIEEYRLRAGYEFGVAEGHGVGTVGAVATSLGAAISNLNLQNVLAVVVLGDQVGLLLRSPLLITVKAKSPSGAIAPFAENFTVSTAPRQFTNLTGSVIQAAPFV